MPNGAACPSTSNPSQRNVNPSKILHHLVPQKASEIRHRFASLTLPAFLQSPAYCNVFGASGEVTPYTFLARSAKSNTIRASSSAAASGMTRRATTTSA